MYKWILIGASAGGLSALQKIIGNLKSDFSVPILVVLHINKETHLDFRLLFGNIYDGVVQEVSDKEPIQKNHIYFAPPDYHVLIERDGGLSLTQEEPVLYSRPSIDVTFESAASSLKEDVCGILLTGANQDGAIGMQCIHQNGGYTIVQNPKEAEVDKMPQSALELFTPDAVLNLNEIANKLNTFIQRDSHGS